MKVSLTMMLTNDGTSQSDSDHAGADENDSSEWGDDHVDKHN